jgi:hypothetical protein
MRGTLSTPAMRSRMRPTINRQTYGVMVCKGWSSFGWSRTRPHG